MKPETKALMESQRKMLKERTFELPAHIRKLAEPFKTTAIDLWYEMGWVMYNKAVRFASLGVDDDFIRFTLDHMDWF